MAQYSGDETKQKRDLQQKALQYALNNQWNEAVAANKSIIAMSPEDAEAYNRLGKAYMSLGMYREAQDAYEHSIKLVPHNAIARKNLERLGQLVARSAAAGESAAAPKAAVKVDASLFIEETGKTGITSLVRPAAPVVLAKMSAGDAVQLVAEDQRLVVKNDAGEYLGQIEPRLGRRLLDLLAGGNKYSAAITSVNDNSVRVIIRETFQHPSQLDKISFPKQGPGLENVRPYIKTGVLMYGGFLDEDDLSDEEYEEEETEEEGEHIDEESEFESDIAEE